MSVNHGIMTRLEIYIECLIECDRLFQPIMTEKFDPRLILKFSGVNPNQSIIELIGKVELMC